MIIRNIRTLLRKNIFIKLIFLFSDNSSIQRPEISTPNPIFNNTQFSTHIRSVKFLIILICIFLYIYFIVF